MGQTFDSFFHKLRFKYKISILNENTLEVSWHLHLSRLNVILFCFGVAVIYFFLIAFLLIKTPFRTFLPGYYSGEAMRKKVMAEAIVMDSLENEVKLHQQYVAMVQKVIAGEVRPDSLANKDTLGTSDYAHVNTKPSDKEREYIEKFEKNSKTDFRESHDTDRPAYTYFMRMPAQGVVTKHFNPVEQQFGVGLNLKPNSNVCASLGGTVTFEGYSRDHMYTVQLQHGDNVVTVYKSSSPFLVRDGDIVRGGQAIAVATQKDVTEFVFEIWESGQPVNPENYLQF